MDRLIRIHRESESVYGAQAVSYLLFVTGDRSKAVDYLKVAATRCDVSAGVAMDGLAVAARGMDAPDAGTVRALALVALRDLHAAGTVRSQAAAMTLSRVAHEQAWPPPTGGYRMDLEFC